MRSIIKSHVSGKSDRLDILFVLVIVGMGVMLFQFFGNTYAGYDVRISTASLFVWLAERWSDSGISLGGEYAHGWIIPFVSIWLVWRRRFDLSGLPTDPGWWGLAAVLGAFVMHGVGLKTELPQLSAMALILLLWSVPTFLRGYSTGRIILFPCAYLLFAVPINIFDSMTFPLRMLASVVSDVMLNGLGIPVTRVGTALHSSMGSGFHLEVADPCSGIRSLTAMMAIVAVYGYVTQQTNIRKWLLFALSLPLSIIGNIGRVLTIGIVASWFGSDIAVGVYHNYSGYVFYVFAVAGMLAVAKGLDTRPLKSAIQGTERPCRVAGRNFWSRTAFAWRASVIVCLFAFVMVAVHRGINVKMMPPRLNCLTLPSVLEGWSGTDIRYCQNPSCLKSFIEDQNERLEDCPVCSGRVDAISYPERALLPSDTTILRKHYRQTGTDWMNVTIVVSGKGRSSIHRPEICLPAQGFRLVASRRTVIPMTGRKPLEMEIITVESPKGEGVPGRTFLFAYWFTDGERRETASHLQRIGWSATDRLFRNTTPRWAYVSILTSVEVSERSPAFIRFVQLLHDGMR